MRGTRRRSSLIQRWRYTTKDANGAVTLTTITSGARTSAFKLRIRYKQEPNPILRAEASLPLACCHDQMVLEIACIGAFSDRGPRGGSQQLLLPVQVHGVYTTRNILKD